MTAGRGLALTAAAVACILILDGCKSTPDPVAGEFTINLATPNTDDGAILVKVTGTGAETVVRVSAACSACKIFSGAVGSGEIRAVITGNISAGAVARVSVSDTNNKASYSVQILDVASRTYVKRAVGGYSLTLQ